MQILIQILGWAAMATVFCSFQVKDPKKTLLVMSGAQVLFTIHFGLAGAITGAIQNLLAIARNLCIIYTDPQKTSGKIAKAIVIAAFAVAPFGFWLAGLEIGVLDFVLGVIMAIAAYLVWTARSSAIRLSQLFMISPCWLLYDALAGSMPGVLTECLNILSVLIFYLRQFLARVRKAK